MKVQGTRARPQAAGSESPHANGWGATTREVGFPRWQDTPAVGKPGCALACGHTHCLQVLSVVLPVYLYT
jgi:hypothetical protein